MSVRSLFDDDFDYKRSNSLMLKVNSAADGRVDESSALMLIDVIVNSY